MLEVLEGYLEEALEEYLEESPRGSFGGNPGGIPGRERPIHHGGIEALPERGEGGEKYQRRRAENT